MKLQFYQRKIFKKQTYLFLAFILNVFLRSFYPISLCADIIPQERKIEWNPGIPDGIPERTIVFANVKLPPYNAVGDGLKDDTESIQTAINDCPANQVVYLPKGTYKISDELVIKKGIVIRGDGPNYTVVKNQSNSSCNIINIDGGYALSAIKVESGYQKGSKKISVANASSLSVGDFIRIYQNNDSALVHISGCSGTCSWCGDSGEHVMGQIVEIIEIKGNELTINRPLYFTFKQSLDPEIKKLNLLKNVGIEDLKLEEVDSRGNNIRMFYVAYCWVRNIESAYPSGSHIRIYSSYRCEIRDSYFHHGHNYDGGGAYGVFLYNRCSDCLIENNIFYVTRHAMIIESGGCGNVFGYNYSKDPQGSIGDQWLFSDMACHGAHPYMNLFEGNVAAHLSCDNIWGSSSHNTFFRNHIERKASPPDEPVVKYGLRAVEIMENNYYINIVGNVLGNEDCQTDNTYYETPEPGWAETRSIWDLKRPADGRGPRYSTDEKVETTLIRHGNYDFLTQSIQWDSNINDHNLPNSYYLISKPDFFDDDTPWPLIGPNQIHNKYMLPAVKRFFSPKNFRFSN